MVEITSHTNNNDTSLVKITPVDTLWGKYGTNIYLRTQTTPSKIEQVSGYEGRIAPQGLFSYDTSSGLLLFITLVYSYLLFRSRSVIQGSFNSIFKKQRERSSIFESEVTAPEIRFRMLVRILGLMGLTVYAYTFAAKLFPHGEITCFAAYFGIKNNMEQYIAQLFFNSYRALFGYGIGQFVGLFYG